MKRKVCVVLGAGLACGLASVSSGQVVISQAYGGGGATTQFPLYTHDYLELKNISGGNVDVGGWSVQYASSTGSTWTRVNLPASPVILAPGQHYLIRLNTATGALGAALPVTPDLSSTTISASATDGKFALVNNQTTLTGTCPTGPSIIDFVGYGSANCSETAAAPSTESSAFGLERRANGCQDTGNNLVDFIRTVPVPRNLASTLEPCAPVTISPELSLSASVTGACVATVGNSIDYVFTVSNVTATPGDATVVITIPSSVTFVSSIPAGTLVGDKLTVNLTAVTTGAPQAITVSTTAASQGQASATGEIITITPAEYTAVNNTAGAGTFIGGATPAVTGLVNTITGHPLAQVAPAGELSVATEFSGTGSFFNIQKSPDGTRFIVRADTTLATTADDLLLSGTTSPFAYTPVWRENTTDFDPGAGVETSDPSVTVDSSFTINDSGNFAISTNTTAAATADECVLANIGGTWSVIAREGNAVTGGVGTLYGTANYAYAIDNSNNVAFHATVTGLTANTDDLVLVNNGGTVRAQEGVFVPTSQVGATTFNMEQQSNTNTRGYSINTAGDWMLNGTLDTAPNTTDFEFVVVNGAVVLQEGSTIPGVPGIVTTITYARYDGPNWFVTGQTNTGDDFVLRNGVVIAKTGDPIVPGSSIRWTSDVEGFALTFFLAKGNNAGDYVIAGLTNAGDLRANAFVVKNGTTIVSRENDPIDLDGNGIFDEDFRIRTYNDHNGILLENGDLITRVTLRNAAGACPPSTNTDLGDALIRIVTVVGSPCPLDLSGNDIVDADDIFAFLNIWFAGPPGGTCTGCDADFDGDGNITADDIFAFLNAWFAFGPGLPCP